MFKNWKISTKLIIGFIVMVILLLVVGGEGYYVMNRNVKNTVHVLEVEGISDTLYQREIEHLDWRDEVDDFLVNQEKTTFQVETDYHKCNLGKWYYGEGRQKAEALVPEMKDTLKTIEDPHIKLHQSVIQLEKLLQGGQRDQAVEYYKSETVGSLKKIRNIFDRLHAISGKAEKEHFQELKEMNDQSEILIISIVALGVLLAGALAFFLTRGIKNPLSRILRRMKEISEGSGDLTKKIDIESKDEVGEIAKYFNGFTEKLRELIQGLKQENNKLSESVENIASNAEETAASVQEITASVQSVTGHIEKEKDMIKSSNEDMQEILTGISEIYTRSQDMEDQVSQSSSSIEEMAANIGSTADMSQRADQYADQLRKSSEEGGSAIRELEKAIQEVSRSSENIEEMVQLIMDISEQTNLLAMNAAIEAAHAGDYGKGFAVVAEEIRKLADRSSQGAREIKDVVNDISENVQNNLDKAVKTRDSFDFLQNNIEKVKQVNHEIAASMEEQKTANRSILEAVNHLKQLGLSVAEKSQAEKQKGQDVGNALKDLNLIGEEIFTAMEEQKKALQEASSASEYLSQISQELREGSRKIKEDFGKFKTE
jgi:methyl-accepting chemotaxis protein